MSTNQMSSALEQAFALFQQGQPIEAENLMVAELRRRQQEFGPQSRQVAMVNYELASLLSVMGRLVDAIDAMRAACSVEFPGDPSATRDRLTYLMQLGELLTQANELEEAERVLREGVSLRDSFYGKEHAGYGFGLEPLAKVLLNQGRLPEALQVIEETIDNFWMNGHPRIASAFPLRALILAELGRVQGAFSDLADVPAAIMDDMAQEATQLAFAHHPRVSQAMLDELILVLADRFGEQHETVTQLRTMWANCSGQVGESEGRLEAIEKVIAAHQANGNREGAIHAMLGLAMAQGELGNEAECHDNYRLAFDEAKRIADLSLQSQCLRNWGLYYSELEQTEDAEKVLRMATKTGERSADEEMFGRSLIALGIFLQHNGKLNEAHKLLQQGLDLLEPSHPDSVCGRSHLNAIQNNQSCGCGSMSNAICEALRIQILEAVPDGLLDDVEVSLQDSSLDVAVQVSRELDEAEMHLLSRTIQQAKIDFQNRIERE